ncbi:MAG: GntR family transcriptional regulator [Planctomycetaceae bacterium]|nr:GntR family transcriptional regulator [Planctomycetaceae bacterium]
MRIVTKPALNFEIHPSSGVPIYRQLMDQMRLLVASGRMTAGELVPSIRQLAEALEVNMMTVSKAYARLEADGVLERDRGVGMRVKAAATNGSVTQRQGELRPDAEQLAAHAWQLQLSDEQALSVVKTALKKRADVDG